MRSILGFLGVKSTPAPTDSETIRRIASELDRLEPEHARYVAAFAFVLSRIAGADHDVTDAETATMERLVSEKGGLPAGQAALVVQMAKTQQLLFGGTDDFLVTRELSRVATYEQKLAIVDCLHAVAAADRQIRSTEADEIARTAKELKVEHADLARIRAAYRDHIVARQGLGE